MFDDPAEQRHGTDGRPLTGVEMQLLDEDGKPVPTGRAGEIWSRGPDLCVGYTDPALTQDAFDHADGWYRTGDMGVVDADGFLTITDRLKDIIIRGGENISAAEVEQAIAAPRRSPKSSWWRRPTSAWASMRGRAARRARPRPSCTRSRSIPNVGLAPEVARGAARRRRLPAPHRARYGKWICASICARSRTETVGPHTGRDSSAVSVVSASRRTEGSMSWDFETEPEYQAQLDWADAFVREEVEPLDLVFPGLQFTPPEKKLREIIDPLKDEVRRHDLWATHLGPELGGKGHGQLKLSLLNEVLGRSQWALIIFGCQAPDTGNAEIIAHYGTPEQKERYLKPLLEGEIFSCYSMTEPHAGADPTMFNTLAVSAMATNG